MDKQYFMYVLYCVDHTLYTGYSTDVEKRLNTHNAGKGAKYTQRRLPVYLLYAKEYSTKSEAMSAEARFKQQTRKQKEQWLQHQTGASLEQLKRNPVIQKVGD